MVQNLSNGDRERRLIAAAADEAGRIDAAGPTRHADPPPELPADSFEGYQITREIRRGGQAVVYQAVQKATKRKVAIKVLLEGTLASPRERAVCSRGTRKSA